MAKTQTQPEDDQVEETSGRATAEIIHAAGCPENPERMETYEMEGPKGYVVVTRCIDCGGHVAGKPTLEPGIE